MVAANTNVDYFEAFTGLSLTPDDAARISVLLDRSRRAVNAQVAVPDDIDGDDLLDFYDAVAELTWLYWEAEKANIMEILALPVSQLSLGTLFWTKNMTMPTLQTVARVISRWGYVANAKIKLEGEIGYV